MTRTSRRLQRCAASLCAVWALVVAVPTATAQEVGISGDLERVSEMTPEQQEDYAAAANAEIDGAVRAIAKLVESGRRDSDQTQLQCTTTKLTAVRALRQVSESAGTAMQERLAAGDTERANHEFRKIAVALSKARQLLAEAERCGDTTALRDGTTTLSVTGGDVGSDDDTKAPEYPVEFDVDFDPPDASPFF